MEHRRNPRWRLHHLILAAILALSAFLNLYGLNQEGYGNEYYAAAVKSMLMNWHNFFFNSFDPNGFITIDKPPVDFWIQALFAWVFGFHGWALMLPQALAGIGSVALLYHLVRRVFGVAAGLIAALVMALTPIAVAVQRTNQVDGLLVFVMLLAAWCLFRALETRRLRWLMGVAVFIGLGFNIKMMEAYLMLPAVYLTYLLARRIRWRRKLLQLAAMTGVLAAVSFSWAVAVDATPASERPYVGSTQTNNEMELIFGYNGLERLTGQMHGASGANSAPMQAASSSSGSAGTVSSAREQAGAGTSPWRTGGTGGQATAERSGWLRGGMGGGGMFNTGRPGPLRLFQSELGGQIGWLLPIALVSLVALLRRVRWRRPLSRREQHAVFWAAWLLPMAVFFSIAGFFHQYYLITMAPGIAALTGAGFAQMWRDARANSRWRWVIPAAALVDFVYQVTLVLPYPQVRVPLIAGGAILLALFALAIWRALRQPTAHAPGFRPETSGFRPAAP
ncbi:ArnT family glycosyltransferase, partial [Alicyclobacillus shizuokensis]|uniref:ArnT family glycosyltransferase n=1 Tax=Alicyclobacillus shizuokensis TaxID=392014 RepID=UPI000830531D